MKNLQSLCQVLTTSSEFKCSFSHGVKWTHSLLQVRYKSYTLGLSSDWLRLKASPWAGFWRCKWVVLCGFNMLFKEKHMSRKDGSVISDLMTVICCFVRNRCLTDCRAAERTTGGVCEQALPRPGEDRQEPEERGTDPSQNWGLEGCHCRVDRIFWRPRWVHPILVSKSSVWME